MFWTRNDFTAPTPATQYILMVDFIVLQLGHNTVAAFQQHADIVANPAVVQPALYSIDP